MRAAAAYAVHFYTASGALFAFAALGAAARDDLSGAFLWLAAAVAIDATDGLLARLVGVAAHAPRIDGARLDDIVDYLTYVFVPAVVMAGAGLFPAGSEPFLAAAVLLASALGFARRDAKTADHFFVGFPSYWNIVAVYLVAFEWPSVLNAGIVLLGAVLVFVPLRYVYPTRTPVLRTPTLAIGGLWGVQMLAIIWMLPAVNRPLLWSSLLFPAYYVVLSLVLHTRRGASGG